MEINDKKFEEELDNFSNIVQEKFSYLINDYGFQEKELEKLNSEDLKDSHIRIDYLNDYVCVRIEWYLADATMGVGLIGLEEGKIPARYSYFEKKGFSPAINLSTLVEFLTNGVVKDPLLNPGPKAGSRKIMKAWREREKLIDQDKRGLLTTYADWLKNYAADILAGDTSIFGAVQRYATEKIERDYYGFSRI